ncbi:MAG: hypothetical protein AAF988_08090, partial [Pseudomonadota bacterium]
MNNNQTQSGNVFILILAGIILFAALGFTFTRSVNKGTGNLSKQQAKIAAQEILNYARLVENAVDRVRRNGCSESEISFENNIESGYENTSAPIDNSCHIFNDNGGKITYETPPESFSDSNYLTNTHPAGWIATGKPIFFNGTCVNGLGNNCVGGGATQDMFASELILYYFYIDEEICIALNNILNQENAPDGTPPTATERFGTTSSSKFIGNF